MRGLKNKRVLITGGAGGIGTATAKRFLEEGSRVFILDRDADACERIQEELPSMETILTADVSKVNEVEKAFSDLDNICQGLDILINNAGISIRHSFLDITPEEWQRLIDINLTGAFHVAQAAARRMKAQGWGVILNMASTNGMTGYPYYADYNASKAGLIALTKSMALELAPEIRVLAVCPGFVLTPMQEAEYSPEMMEAANKKVPLQRHAQPAEVAALFAFLASEEAGYLTGHCYMIDGGELAGGLASR
jgi:meso-butanediol dehydrogenase/(S,S)-butanediol dehydrogenase/diacetyl reductase